MSPTPLSPFTSAAPNPATRPTTSSASSTTDHQSDYPDPRLPVRSAEDLLKALSEYREISTIIVDYWNGEPRFLLLVDKSLNDLQQAVTDTEMEYLPLPDGDHGELDVTQPRLDLMENLFLGVLTAAIEANTAFHMHRPLIFIAQAFTIVDSIKVGYYQTSELLRSVAGNDIWVPLKPHLPMLRLVSSSMYPTTRQSPMDAVEEAFPY